MVESPRRNLSQELSRQTKKSQIRKAIDTIKARLERKEIEKKSDVERTMQARKREKELQILQEDAREMSTEELNRAIQTYEGQIRTTKRFLSDPEKYNRREVEYARNMLPSAESWLSILRAEFVRRQGKSVRRPELYKEGKAGEGTKKIIVNTLAEEEQRRRVVDELIKQNPKIKT